LPGHTDQITSILVIKNQQRIVSSSDDGKIKIWDIATGESVKSLTGHTASVKSILITKDKEQIISGCLEDEIKIWNIANGECVKTLSSGRYRATSLQY